MEDEAYYGYLLFCPECGKRLETSPISGLKSCLLHGEFRVYSGSREMTSNESQQRIRVLQWKPTENLVNRA